MPVSLAFAASAPAGALTAWQPAAVFDHGAVPPGGWKVIATAPPVAGPAPPPAGAEGAALAAALAALVAVFPVGALLLLLLLLLLQLMARISPALAAMSRRPRAVGALPNISPPTPVDMTGIEGVSS